MQRLNDAPIPESTPPQAELLPACCIFMTIKSQLRILAVRLPLHSGQSHQNRANWAGSHADKHCFSHIPNSQFGVERSLFLDKV
jgi:hypothetical protein